MDCVCVQSEKEYGVFSVFDSDIRPVRRWGLQLGRMLIGWLFSFRTIRCSHNLPFVCRKGALDCCGSLELVGGMILLLPFAVLEKYMGLEGGEAWCSYRQA